MVPNESGHAAAEPQYAAPHQDRLSALALFVRLKLEAREDGRTTIAELKR
jgi:hypothetical protein